MKNLFTAPFALLLFISFASAQTKATVKVDTAKSKSGKSVAKTDTANVKFPLPMQTAKFDKIDSADLNLTPNVPITRYGFVDTAELRLKECDFEKDANAMVLFDRVEMAVGTPNIIMERQKRIKIFNDNGKGEADIKIELNQRFGVEKILRIEAETVNLTDGKIQYTKLDPKLIYGQHTNKNGDEVIFTFPNVKAGSVIEYRYLWVRPFSRNVPSWDFQDNIPCRYSQAAVFVNPAIIYSALYKNHQPFARDTALMNGVGHVWALSFVPSLKDEPYMRSAVDIRQGLAFAITGIVSNGKITDLAQSWANVGQQFADDKEITNLFDQGLHDEDDLVKIAKVLKTDDSKIAFLFDTVKTLMKWNEEKNWISKDGIKNAWKKKSGNWGEINMILCRLLNLTGIKTYPMLVSTRDNGYLMPNFVNIYQVNKLVAYVPVDSTAYYVLDATDKYNMYDEVPFDLLNSYGLYINKDQQKYRLVFLKKALPVKQAVFINADIHTDGTMKGTAQINSFSYNKSTCLELFKTLDEKKYRDYLTDDDNNLKITSLKIENATVDSLPLTQDIDFSLDLPGTDDKYIYFSPNLFTSLHNNPFISKERVSDIDFGTSNIFSINGRYKIPAGYKIEAMPKNILLVTPDKSISFKRIIGEDEGYVIINYVINYKQSIYKSLDYDELHAYFKKMNETLNEQIILKKI